MDSWETNISEVVVHIANRSSYIPRECMKQTESERVRISYPVYVIFAATQMQLTFASPSCQGHQQTCEENMQYKDREWGKV